MDDSLLKVLTIIWLVGIVFAFIALRVLYKVREEEFSAADAFLLYGVIPCVMLWPLTIILIPIAVTFEKATDIIAGWIKGERNE